MPKDVDVYIQPKAWFDTATSLQFANHFRNQVRPASEEKLLGLDNLNSQCASQFIDTMRKAKVQLIYTPPDCTDLCAVTDAVSFFSRERYTAGSTQCVRIPRVLRAVVHHTGSI